MSVFPKKITLLLPVVFVVLPSPPSVDTSAALVMMVRRLAPL